MPCGVAPLCYCKRALELAHGWCCCHFLFIRLMLLPCVINWLMLLPVADVVALVVDVISTHGWVGRCYSQGGLMEKPLGQFNFNSGNVYRTSSHIWGRWYLPMFLFRDGSLTLMNRASLIALIRFCSSLPTIVKLLMLMLWPEVLQWSNIGEGAFWCSLNPHWLHLYLYMTPLLFVIGSLSLGAMRRFLMVWPPLKNTWTPNLLHDLLILSLSPWWYGTTMYKFVLFFWPVWLVLLVLLLEFWLLILALLIAHVGYLHLVRALKRCSSSCNSWGVEQTVDALWNRDRDPLHVRNNNWTQIRRPQWKMLQNPSDEDQAHN